MNNPISTRKMLRIDRNRVSIGKMPSALIIAGNDTGLKVKRKMVKWGTFVIGRHVRVRMEESPHGQ